MIAPHSCKSNAKGKTNGVAFQEKKYGKGMRVWTTNKDGLKSRCTVCGNK